MLMVTTGCGSSSNQQTLTLIQEPGPVKSIVSDHNPNDDAGDEYAFEGPILKDGKPYGVMLGTITTLFAGIESWHPESEARLLTAVFDLPGGQISVVGATYRTPDGAQGDFKSLTRPVVGGSGGYLNARGEVTTTYNESDDTYTHVITYSTD